MVHSLPSRSLPSVLNSWKMWSGWEGQPVDDLMRCVLIFRPFTCLKGVRWGLTVVTELRRAWGAFWFSSCPLPAALGLGALQSPFLPDKKQLWAKVHCGSGLPGVCPSATSFAVGLGAAPSGYIGSPQGLSWEQGILYSIKKAHWANTVSKTPCRLPEVLSDYLC